MSAIIEESALSDLLNSVSVLVDECRLHLESDGLEISAVDPANVGMVTCGLEEEAFESYGFDGGEIGVDLNRLEDIVGMADNGGLIEFSLNEETRKLEIEADGLEYTLALIDPDSIRQEPEIPDLDLGAEVVLEGRDIARGVKAADLVSKHIDIRYVGDSDALVFEADGDTDDVSVTVDDELIDWGGEDVLSKFSLDYLEDMNKAIPKTAEVRLELGDEMPFKLHYRLADGAGNVTYLLAPRIDSS